MSLSRWMHKYTVVHPDNGLLFRAKKKWAAKPWNDMEETEVCITKWKKPIWKGFVLYDSNYVTFWKRQNSADIRKMSGQEGLREEKGMNR